MAGPGGQERGRISVRVVPDTSAFARSLHRYLERIERTTRLDIGLGLDQADLRQTEARLAQLTRERDINLGLDNADLVRAELRIAQLTRDRRMTVGVDVDQGALNRVRAAFAGIGGSSGSGGITFDDSGMSRHTKRLIAMAAAITAAIPAVLGLSAALGQATGVLALLPALGLAGAASIAVLALAFTNLDTAGSEFEHITRELSRLKDEFVDLQQSVQAEFFADLAHPIRDLAEQYLPTLRRRLTGIAGAFNALSLGLIAFAAQQQTLQDTAGGLSDTETSIRNLTPGILAFAAAFRDLAAVGGSFLPGLSTALSDAATRFAAFIAGARASGELADFFQRSLDAVESLGRSIINLGSAFRGLITANGDTAPFLANLELVTGAIDKLINSAGGQAGFGALFDGISRGFASLLGNLPVLESLIASAGPVFGELFAQIGLVAGAMQQTFAPALAALSPVLTEVLATVGGAVADALIALSPAITSLAEQLGPFLLLLGTEFAGVLAVLAPVIGTVAEALGGAFLTVLSALTPVLADLLIALAPVAEALGVALADALVLLAPHLEEMARAFMDEVVPAILALIPYLPQLVTSFVDLVVALLPLIPALGELIAAVIGLVPLIPLVLLPFIAILQVLVTWISTVIGWIASLITWFKNLATGLYNSGALIIQVILNLMHNFALLAASVSARVGEVVAVVRGLPGRLVSALGNLGGLLINAGRALIGGLIQGIRDRIAPLLATMSYVMGLVAEFGPGSPVKRGPLRAWNNGAAGKKLVDLLASGLQDSTKLDAAMRSLTSRIRVPELDGTIGLTGLAGAGTGGPLLHVGNLYARDDEAAANVLVRRFGDAAAVYGMVG